VSKRMRELFNTVPIKKTRRQILMKKLKEADVAPLDEQAGQVTPQQWLFIKSLCDEDGKVTLRQAAINAGYPEDKASKTANNLTSAKLYPHVVRAIQDYRYEQAEKYGTNFERHMRDLQVIRDKALEAGNYGAAVSAEFRRGQALGSIYIDKKMVLTGSIDQMSKEQVTAKLQELQALHGSVPALDEPKEIDVTPATTGMLEAMRNVERTRSTASSQAQEEPAELIDSEAGEQSELGPAGLPDSATASEVLPSGTEGSDDRQEGPPERTPSGVCSEPRKDGPANLHSDRVASERDD
jgi:hypothetical protein